MIKEKILYPFFTEYINSSLLPNGGRNQQICNYNTPVKPGHVCAVEVNNWGPCSPNHQYGFNNSAPCIFIKLNRVCHDFTTRLFLSIIVNLLSFIFTRRSHNIIMFLIFRYTVGYQNIITTPKIYPTKCQLISLNILNLPTVHGLVSRSVNYISRYLKNNDNNSIAYIVIARRINNKIL